MQIADSIFSTFVSAVVEFAINGNKADAEAQLNESRSVEATITFQGRKVKGHHQGMRAIAGGSRNMFGVKTYTIVASGRGTFNSTEGVFFEGIFVNNKLHDTTGNATCSIGTTEHYLGSFVDGHMSGYGVLKMTIDGVLRPYFQGTWKESKQWTGDILDGQGGVLMTKKDGVPSTFGPAPGPLPPAPPSLPVAPSPGNAALRAELEAMRIQNAHLTESLATLTGLSRDRDAALTMQLEASRAAIRAVEPNTQARDLSKAILFKAATTGDTTVLLELQRRGMLGSLVGVNELHTFQPTGWTIAAEFPALSIACFYDHTAVVDLLLLHLDIDVNARNSHGRYALIIAAQKGSLACVQAILRNNRVDVNVRDQTFLSNAFLWACAEGHTEVVRVFLADPRVDVLMRNKHCKNALVCAEKGRFETIQLLLSDSRFVQPSEVNCCDNQYGSSTLMWASSHGHLNIVQALLHLSVTDVNIRNIDDRTALFFASFGGHTTVVQALLGDSRVNSTLHDKNGRTALDAAKTEQIRALLINRAGVVAR